MFLHLLNEPEKRLFWRAVMQMVHADDALHEREKALKDALERELGLGLLDRAKPSDVPLEDELAQIPRPIEAHVFLLELAGVALADGELHPMERELLDRYAAAMQVNSDRLDTFIDFAARARDLNDEARMLVLEPAG